MKEGTPLKEQLYELNFVLMELHDIDVKMEQEDLAMILLIFLPPSYEYFVIFLNVGMDSITLEEVNSSLYSRRLRLKESWNGDEASASKLLGIDYAKRQKKKKGKYGKSKFDPKDICNYCKELSQWKRECPKKARKILLVLLFIMIPHRKSNWFRLLANNYNNILNNGY